MRPKKQKLILYSKSYKIFKFECSLKVEKLWFEDKTMDSIAPNLEFTFFNSKSETRKDAPNAFPLLFPNSLQFIKFKSIKEQKSKGIDKQKLWSIN